jgi:hypothetical protein
MFVNLHDEKFYIVVARLVSFHSTWLESQGSGEKIYSDLKFVVEFVSSRYQNGSLKRVIHIQ